MDNENVTVESKKNGGKKIIITVVVLVILAIAGYFVFGHKNLKMGSGSENPPVATVNGVAISKEIFDTQLASAVASYTAQGGSATSTEEMSQIKKQVLDNLINKEVLNQAIEAAKIVASQADVDKQYQALVAQVGGADKLQAQLTQSKMTDDQLRQNIAKQLTVQTYLLQNIDVKSITVTDAEISQFYSQYSAQMKSAGQTVPALSALSAQIKQQIMSNKEQSLIADFVASLRAKANVVITM
jgi:FKBP-type peptidyl-prolyl cis-trans isomerase (trigger factor)